MAKGVVQIWALPINLIRWRASRKKAICTGDWDNQSVLNQINC